MDVVKTRMQLDPAKYNKGMIAGFRQVIAGEGAGALLTGFGPTASGYFIQGWFKFGGMFMFLFVFFFSFSLDRQSRDISACITIRCVGI